MATDVESGRLMRLARIREWLTLASIVVVVLGGLLGGMRLVVEPLHVELRAINGRLDRMDARLDRMEGRMDRMDARMDRMEGRQDRMEGSITGLYKELAAIRERLRRLETLIEGGALQPGAPQ